jgi:5-methylcytosine-specific restriction endonuclease McrA
LQSSHGNSVPDGYFIVLKEGRSSWQAFKVKSWGLWDAIADVAINNLKKNNVERNENSPLNTSQKNLIIKITAKGRCEYPSCNQETHLEVHHIITRSEGGSNELSNLIILCPNHHRMAQAGDIPRDKLQYIVKIRKQ